MTGFGFKRFAREEDGSVTAFIVVLFLMMVVAAGMAVDFMRQETARADLQNALDRGVLAAASFSQTLTDKELVVSDYMKSRSFDTADMTLNVIDDQGDDFSRVEARAQYEIKTFFLRLIGINTLTVPAFSAAEQRQKNVEISLVVDISGSMTRDASTGGTSKIEQLKVAAGQFVDTMLADDAIDRTTISVIPYSTNVAVPPAMAALYNLQPVNGATALHNYSYCFDFQEDDFADARMLSTTEYIQAQHFVDRRQGSVYHRHCPAFNNAILPLSNDAVEIKNMINGLTTEFWTTTYNGIKWGTALLDPTSRNVVGGLVSAGLVDAAHTDLPRDWDADNILKVLVVMTDGRNTVYSHLRDDIYVSQPFAFWDTRRPNMDNNGTGTPSAPRFRIVDNQNLGDEGDVRMWDICDAAKAPRDGNNGIRVFTIGFEISDENSPQQVDARAALATCGSTASDNFVVDGLQINDAFEQIAATIQRLKLTK